MTPRGVSRLRPTRRPPEKDSDRGEQPDRPEERGRQRAATEPDPAHADEEVGERRGGERGAPEHLTTVEERERQPEREQCEQVERVPAPQAPPVGEADEEDDAERNPHPPRVEDLAPERTDTAASHPPGDLRARPGLGHAPVSVLDLPERDLARLARPDLDRPAARCVVEHGVGRRMGRVALEPTRDLGVREESRDDFLLTLSRAVLRSERLLAGGFVSVVAVVGSAASATGETRAARARARAPASPHASSPAERPELVPDEVERRDDHDCNGLCRELPHACSRRARRGRRGSRRARTRRRRGTSVPGKRHPRVDRGTSRVDSRCSCSPRRRETIQRPRGCSARRPTSAGSRRPRGSRGTRWRRRRRTLRAAPSCFASRGRSRRAERRPGREEVREGASCSGEGTASRRSAECVPRNLDAEMGEDEGCYIDDADVRFGLGR